VSTRLLLEGADLATLLSRVRSELGPGARVVRAERVRTGGIAGFFAREHFELTIDVPEKPVALDRPRAVRQAHTVQPPGIDALLDAADAVEAEAALPTVSTGGAAFADVLEQVRALVGDPTGSSSPTGSSHPTVAEAVVVPTGGADGDGSRPGSSREPLAGRLAAIGVPERLLADDPRSLSQALVGVPVAAEPVRGAGQVLAVVGAVADADAVARLLAERLRLDAAAVVAGGTSSARGDVPRPRGRGAKVRPTSPDEATRWRQGVAHAPHPTIVALAVGDDADERARAAAILAAVGADQTWAVVDARTRTLDARAWMAAVGTFDAVAVRGAFDTAAPGALLDLGAPVAWLDGVPATAASWAALLYRALGGAGTWD